MVSINTSAASKLIPMVNESLAKKNIPTERILKELPKAIANASVNSKDQLIEGKTYTSVLTNMIKHLGFDHTIEQLSGYFTKANNNKKLIQRVQDRHLGAILRQNA